MDKKTTILCGFILALVTIITAGPSAGQVRAGRDYPHGRANPFDRAYLYDRAPDPDSVEGVFVPNRKQFGYYPTKWRPWPTVKPGAPGAKGILPKRVTPEELPPFEIPPEEEVEQGENPTIVAPPQKQEPVLGPSVPPTTPLPLPRSTEQDAAPKPPKDTENLPPSPPPGLRNLDQRPLFGPEPAPQTPPLRGPFHREPIDGSPSSSSPFGQIPHRPAAIFLHTATQQHPAAMAELLGDRSHQDRFHSSNPLRSTSKPSIRLVTSTTEIRPPRAASRVQRVSFVGPLPANEPAKQLEMAANPLR